MKHLLEFEQFILEATDYKNLKVNLYKGSRRDLATIAKGMKAVVDLIDGAVLSQIIDTANNLSEYELLANHKEWINEFNHMQNLLYSYYAVIYKAYSTLLNHMHKMNDDYEMMIMVNGEPLKNLRVKTDPLLYKSILNYDPDINRLKNNLYNSWYIFKTYIPQNLSSTRAILEEFGIFTGEIGKQLRPPKLHLKAKDYTGSGNSRGHKMSYYRLIENAAKIEDNNGWDTKNISNEFNAVLTFLDLQADDDSVIKYRITKKGLR